MPQILIIEDDADIASVVAHALERDGAYRVTVATDGESGLQRSRAEAFDLVLLDLNLPGIDGMEVCRQLRSEEHTRMLPIIMLTARGEESARVRGLESGADDYVSKPFSTKELIARVRAVLRRSRVASGRGEELRCGELRVDPATRRVHLGDGEIALTRKEFDLLYALMEKRGRVLSRERLLESVWGYEHPGSTRTVDVHVRQVRKKIGAENAARIETVVGVGYRFRSGPV